MKLEDTIKGFREILDGKHDDLPEQAFYMVGTIEDAVAKARKLSGDDEAPPTAEESDAEDPKIAKAEAEPEPVTV